MVRFLAPAVAVLVMAAAAHAAPPSGVTGIDVLGAQPVGAFGGVKYVRTWGVVHGEVSPTEAVVGLDAQPKGADGAYGYTAEFEVIAPAPGQLRNAAVFVEAENRGSPLLVDLLNHLTVSGKPSTAVYPEGLGDGFLFRNGISYARVQWQTGLAAGVPDQAQGVGEVVMRDFARLLAGQRLTLDPAKAGPDFGVYPTRILAGVSQSAWFVNSFIAEGFNADPASGAAVFKGALAIDGTGNWMTLNGLAQSHGYKQYPYLNELGAPLAPDHLFTRPKSDPLYLDVANYNDFFRVRASLSEGYGFPANMRRYDWPSPHAAGSKANFPARCNGGTVVALDPISYGPYARALVLELVRKLGGTTLPAPPLPPTTLFTLAPPPTDPVHFNALPGADAKVPALADNGQPVGGVRFPEDDAPLGDPGLPLPHVGLDSIADTCGNILQWRPYTKAELASRYGGEDAYFAKYGAAIDRLVAKGYVLADDKADMLATAQRLYRAAE